MSELETQIFNVLQEHKEYFVEEDLLTTMVRRIAWNLVRILMSVVDAFQKLFLDLWKLPDFFESEVFKEIQTPFFSAMAGIATLSLMIYAIRRMINTNLKTQSFIDSLLLGTGTVFLSTILIGQLLSASTQISKELIEFDTGTNYVYKIIEGTGKDTLKAIRNNFNEKEDGIHLTTSTIQFFDYGKVLTENYIKEIESTEPLVPIEGLGDEWFKVFNYKVDLDTVDNSATLQELNGFGSWLGIQKGYYRYNINLVGIIFYLISYLLVICFSLIKYIQLFFEIALTQTILPLFAYTDLDGAKDLKKLLKNLKNAMLTMVLCALSLKMFSVFQYWIIEQEFKIGSIIVMQIGLALVVIDGANIIQQITGYDAGIKSVAQTVTALTNFGIKAGNTAGKMVGSGAGVGKLAGNVGRSLGLSMQQTGAYKSKSPSDNNASSAPSAFGGQESKEAYVADKMKGFKSESETGKDSTTREMNKERGNTGENMNKPSDRAQSPQEQITPPSLSSRELLNDPKPVSPESRSNQSLFDSIGHSEIENSSEQDRHSTTRQNVSQNANQATRSEQRHSNTTLSHTETAQGNNDGKQAPPNLNQPIIRTGQSQSSRVPSENESVKNKVEVKQEVKPSTSNQTISPPDTKQN